jgi:hypothetical protein
MLRATEEIDQYENVNINEMAWHIGRRRHQAKMAKEIMVKRNGNHGERENRRHQWL